MDELNTLRSNGLSGPIIVVIMFKSLVDKHEEIKKSEVKESDTEIVINRNKLVEAISNLYSSEGNESIKRVIKSIVLNNEIWACRKITNIKEWLIAPSKVIDFNVPI